LDVLIQELPFGGKLIKTTNQKVIRKLLKSIPKLILNILKSLLPE
jgi:hypothetical protein